MWASTVRSAMKSRSAIARLDRPSATRASTSSFAIGGLLQRSGSPRTLHEGLDDRGVDDRLALAEPAKGVHEHCCVRDPLLE